MTNNPTYNGWANYETWNFFMWEGDVLQQQADEMHSQLGGELEFVDVLEMVEDYIDYIQDEHVSHGFVSDIMGHALRSIDKYEVTRHLVEEMDI